MRDSINPDHYQGGIECIDAIEEALTPEEFVGFCKGNVFKYLWRCNKKNGIEDLQKAKWYLDRLIDSFEANEPKQPAWTPKVGDWVRIKKPDDTHLFGPVWVGEMDKYDGQIIEVKEIIGGGIVQDRWGFLFDWLQPAEQPKARAISDTIPEGYRKLKDSSEEPRKLGDLRWSISQKRYVEIDEEEIGYANRDNWAAYRKVEPVVKQSLTPKPSDGLRFRDWPSDSQESSTNDTDQDDHPHDFKVGDSVISWQGREGVIEAINLIEDFPITVRHSIREQVSYKLGGVKKKHDDHPGVKPVVKQSLTPDTPDGWRWLEVGEVIRKGDRFFNGDQWKDRDWAIGETYGPVHQKTIRCNRFEAGEKVIEVRTGRVYEIESYSQNYDQYSLAGFPGSCVNPEHLAPYIESTKRYREPTPADLKNGAIECEVREDAVGAEWKPRVLIGIEDQAVYPFRVLCARHPDKKSRWPLCRIEATE